jgi:pyridinium-3,5-biscarboxylic acid mononucleotide sulfurtransferase
MTDNKLKKLDEILNELGSFVVAFSGGVDSSFLLHRAHIVRKSAVIAVTIRTPYIPQREIDEAIEFTTSFGINHKILELGFPEIIKNNPLERCYLCKKTLFSEILSFASSNGIKNIIDGTNSDDAGEYRPGMKALKEMAVRSPLLEAGLTKNDIRQFSHDAGLRTWDMPAMACLLTRIPYDTEVSDGMLRMIEAAENLFFESGYPGTRVRIHGDLARIESLPGFMEKIIQNPDRDKIISGLKKIGFRYISLDLEGYRTGSYNPDKTEV